MKSLRLNNTPEVALVDDDDFHFVDRRQWRLDDKGYPVTNICSRIIKLHNFILPATNACVLDHINGQKLDNRKSNLRLVGATGNAQNRGKQGGLTTSRYKGCWFDGKTKKWRARIVAHGKYHGLGSYATEIEAARAWDSAALRLHGPHARLNFPMDLDVPSDSPLFLPEKRVVQSTDDLKVNFPTDKANRRAG